MSVSTALHKIRTLGASIRARTPYGYYELQRKRDRDQKWWHNWLTHPIRRMLRYLNTLDFAVMVLLVLTFILGLILLFSTLMAILSVFDIEQHNQVMISIGFM